MVVVSACAGVSPANYAAVLSWPIRLVEVLPEPPQRCLPWLVFNLDSS